MAEPDKDHVYAPTDDYAGLGPGLPVFPLTSAASLPMIDCMVVAPQRFTPQSPDLMGCLDDGERGFISRVY